MPSDWATRPRSFGLLAARLEPLDAAALYDAADGRDWKKHGLLNDWAICVEPTALVGSDVGWPFASIRLPCAWWWKKRICPTTQTAAGYSTQR